LFSGVWGRRGRMWEEGKGEGEMREGVKQEVGDGVLAFRGLQYNAIFTILLYITF
jgi:hypothetical protein